MFRSKFSGLELVANQPTGFTEPSKGPVGVCLDSAFLRAPEGRSPGSRYLGFAEDSPPVSRSNYIFGTCPCLDLPIIGLVNRDKEI
jgi:hypothetical protein